MLLAWLSAGLVAGTSLFALLQGRDPERLGGLLMGFLLVASWLNNSLADFVLLEFDIVGLTVDIIGFAGFFWIALQAIRIWPLWVAALQLVAVCSHLVHEMDIAIDPLAYGLMRYSPTSIASAIILVSTILSLQSKQTNANAECWRDWSALSSQRRQNN